MKKRFLGFLVAFISLLLLVSSQSFAAETAEPGCDSEIYKGSYLIQLNKNLNTDLAKFFSQKTLAYTEIKLNEKNINYLKELILRASPAKTEEPGETADTEHSEDSPPVSNKKQEILMAFQLLSNLSKMFGPDLSIGMFHPLIPLEEMTDFEPCILFATPIKTDDFSSEFMMTTFAKDKEFEVENYYNYDIYYYKTGKNSISFSNVDNNLLFSNNLEIIKQAIDNRNLSTDNFLTLNEVQKTLNYIPDQFFGLLITNNTEIAAITKKFNEIKEKRRAAARKLEEEKEAALQKELEGESQENSDHSFLDKDIPDNIEKVDTDEDTVQAEQKEKVKNTDLFEKYYNELTSTARVTAITAVLGENKIELETQTPYNLGFIGQASPNLQVSIESFIATPPVYEVSRVLPASTAAYVSLANPGGIVGIMNNIDDEKFQQTSAGMKMMMAMMLGLDPDTEILPLLSGQTTVAVVNHQTHPEPLFVISTIPETEERVNIIVQSLKNMEEGKKIKIKKMKENGVQYKTIISKKMPVNISYGIIQNNLVVARDVVMKELASQLYTEESILNTTNKFSYFKTADASPQNFAIYASTPDVVNLFKRKAGKVIPEDVQDKLKAVYFIICTPIKNVMSAKLILQLAEPAEQ
jgi:hypothetical protein